MFPTIRGAETTYPPVEARQLLCFCISDIEPRVVTAIVVLPMAEKRLSGP